MRLLSALVVGVCLGLLPACGLTLTERTPPPRPAASSDASTSARTPRPGDRLRLDVRRNVDFIAGWSVERRPIHYRVHGDGPEVILVIATIHGNEPAGTPLVNRLSRELAARPARLDGRTVVVVPVANPDGLAAATRTNARGVDLNRNYATANFRESPRNGPRPLSEPESRILAAMITRFQPSRVLSIHQPLACVDHDGPGRRLAAIVAARSGLGLKKLGARPGSFGSFVGVTLDIPIVTLELPAAATRQSADELWRRYGEALLGFLAGDTAYARLTRDRTAATLAVGSGLDDRTEPGQNRSPNGPRRPALFRHQTAGAVR